MTRPSEPGMHDVTDKEVHRKEGVDPYPVPKKTEEGQRSQDDTKDPGDLDPDAPHDRGKAHGDRYVDGIESMRKQLEDEGKLEDWEKGRTQGAPRKN